MAADMLTRGGEEGQNFGKSAYVILEQSLAVMCWMCQNVIFGAFSQKEMNIIAFITISYHYYKIYSFIGGNNLILKFIE